MKSPCPSRDSRRAASRSAASFQGAPHREIYEEVNNDGGGVFSHYQDRTSSVPVPRPLAKEPPQEPATNGIRSRLSKPCAPHPGVPEDIMYDESKSYTRVDPDCLDLFQKLRDGGCKYGLKQGHEHTQLQFAQSSLKDPLKILNAWGSKHRGAYVRFRSGKSGKRQKCH